MRFWIQPHLARWAKIITSARKYANEYYKIRIGKIYAKLWSTFQSWKRISFISYCSISFSVTLGVIFLICISDHLWIYLLTPFALIIIILTKQISLICKIKFCFTKALLVSHNNMGEIRDLSICPLSNKLVANPCSVQSDGHRDLSVLDTNWQILPTIQLPLDVTACQVAVCSDCSETPSPFKMQSWTWSAVTAVGPPPFIF